MTARARLVVDCYVQHLDVFDARPQQVALEAGELLDLLLRDCFERLFCPAQDHGGAYESQLRHGSCSRCLEFFASLAWRSECRAVAVESLADFVEFAEQQV